MPLDATKPGATALTRVPLAAHSTASVCVRFIMPARAAPLCAMAGMPPHISAIMLTIEPPRLAKQRRYSSRAIRKPPVRLAPSTASKPFLLIACAGDGNCPPALLTKPWIAPSRSSSMVLTASLTASSSRISKAAIDALPPSATISSTVADSFSGFRPVTMTCAPSAANSCAVQRPMPEPPPVTI